MLRSNSEIRPTMTASSAIRDLETFRPQRRNAILIITLMGLILVASTLWKRYFLSTNPASRIITVERLVEAGTFAHATPTDTTPFELSIDAIKVGQNIYSSKPPNYPLLMAAESMAIKGVTGWEFYEHRRDYVRLLTLINQVIPYCIMLYVFFLFLRKFTQDSWTLNFMLLAMGIGSLPYAYASSINNHTLSAFLFMFGLIWTYRLYSGTSTRWWEYLLLGVLIGFASTIELPGLAFGGVFWLLLAKKDWRRSLWVLLGAVLPLIPTLIVFKIISGSWKPFYFQGELYRFEGSYWTKPSGLDALKESKLSYLFHILIGYKGLFFVTPLLLLSVVGIARGFWGKYVMDRWFHWGMTAAVLAVFVFVWTRTYNYGGDCVGLRWMIVAMPFMTFLSWPVVERLGASWYGKTFCLVLLAAALPHVEVALEHDAFVKAPLEESWGAFLRGLF